MSIPPFLLLGVLAALIWSFSNIIDKYMLGGHISNPAAVTFFTSIFGTGFSLILPFLGLVTFSSVALVGSSILLGSLYILPILLYMKALKIGEVSRVVPIFSSSPVFVVLLGAIFLGEIFSLRAYAGIFLTIAGSVIISSNKVGKEFFSFKLNKAFWTIISSTILLAIYSILTKYLLQFDGFWNIFFWSRIGTLLPTAAILMHSESRKAIFSALKNMRNNRLEYLGLSEFFNNLGVLIQTIALSLGPVSLVRTAVSSQALFILLITILLQLIYDYDLGDDLSRKTATTKALASALIIMGIYLIT